MSSSSSNFAMSRTNGSVSRTNSSKITKTASSVTKEELLPPTTFNKTLKAIQNYKNEKNDITPLKEEIKKKINMYFIGFFCIFLILIISTSSIVIDKYKEVCLKNPNLKNDMNVIYGIAIFNITLTILLIISCVIIYFNIKVDFITKNKNYIVYIFILLITIMNMSINSRFIKIRSRCYSDSEQDQTSNWLWINYALTLPICLLIIILYYLYDKFKLENWKFS